MSSILNEDTVQILECVDDWKEAIKVCAKPLLQKKYIDEKYIDSIISKAVELGPYFDFGKGIAVPHSRPEDGSHENAISLLKLNNNTKLLDLDDHKIDVFIVLSAKDNTSHLDLLKKLADVLVDDEKVNKLKSANTKEEIIKLFQ